MRSSARASRVAPSFGSVYGEYLRAEVEREHARRASLQARGSSLTGLSAGYLALGSAGVAVGLGADHRLSGTGSLLVLAALLSFIAAAVVSVSILAITQEYRVASVRTLSAMVNARWRDSDASARRAVATLAATELATLRAGNNRAARHLVAGGWLQIAGLGALTAALVLEYLR